MSKNGDVMNNFYLKADEQNSNTKIKNVRDVFGETIYYTQQFLGFHYRIPYFSP